jgi:hypothetical protein
MTENHRWMLYRASVLEADRNKRLDRAKVAEDAIRDRASLDGPVSSEVRISIQDEVAALLVLRRELAQHPAKEIKHQRDV